MDCKKCKYYTGKMGRCERFYGCAGEESMAKTTKRKTNNPNHDYVPPHVFGGITCAELSDALDRIYSPQKPAEMKAKERLKPLNCPNCGAPVRGGECEYCGTVFSTENDVNVVLDVDAVASAARRYNDSAERTVRHFNPKTHQWEWVAENPAKAVRTPLLPTKHGRW